MRRRHRVRAEEALADRVERAGADVAVDDADRAERERKQAAAPAVWTCVRRARSSGAARIPRRRGEERPLMAGWHAAQA